VENKVRSIELIDEKVVGFLRKELKERNIDYKMMILPDHPTPLKLRTHTRDAVPYIIYDSTNEKESGIDSYTEKNAEKSSIMINEGHNLIKRLFN